VGQPQLQCCQQKKNRRSDQPPVGFVVITYDRDGKILNVVNRSFKLNFQPAQYDRIMQTGLPLHQETDGPTGKVYLRIGVHDLSTDRVGSI